MFYEKKGSLQREFMAELYFIDWEAWYFFIESTFIGLTRSSPSILDNNKAPHCLAPIYSDLLLVKGNIFFSTRSPSWNPRGRTFLSYDLAILL
jgi:hypothetical protein